MSDLDRSEFAAGYLIEADEHVRAAITNLLAIEQALRQGGPQHRAVRELFRSLHTLKGLSAMVGVDPVVDIAHEMETVLRDLDRGTAKLSAESVELLLQGVRAIELRVAAFSQGQTIPQAPRSLLDALAEMQTEGRFAPEVHPSGLTLEPELLNKLSPSELVHLSERISAGARALRVDFYPSPDRAAAGFSITSVREQVAELGEIVKVIPRAVPKNDAAPGGLAFALIVLSEADVTQLARAASTDTSSLTPITLAAASGISSELDASNDAEPDDLIQLNRGTIRVEVARLDDALEKLSALVVTRFKLTHAVNALRERGVDVRDLSAILNQNHRQLRDLRRAITRARMVSVAELLERVPLIVRGMKRTTGKQVRLVIDAGRAELDKAVAERVFPAIVHLVRNAIDHAIETPAEREALGKSAEGMISVACFEHSDTQLEICVSDDGRGIDAAAVSKRASRPQPQDARGLLELLTLPGLSTVDTATSNSGRGMGMDIVRRISVEMLGGELSLQTTPGRGSAFTMRLPLSISILDSFSFVCGPQSFAVPMSVVDEIIDLEAERIVNTPTPHASHGAPQLSLLERRGEAIPLYGLASLLRLPAAKTGRGKAFIIRPQGQALAFAIDRVLGQQEIVVRPVVDPLVRVPGVAGTTDLGDGQPTLVLDLVGLSQVALTRSGELNA